MATNYNLDAYETTVQRVDTNPDGSTRLWNGFADGPVPTTWRKFFWTAAGNGFDANSFTVTEVGAATQTMSDVDDGGAVLLANSAADNDRTVVRQCKGTDGTGGLWLTHKPGKLIIIEGWFSVSNATQCDMFFGVFNKSTDPVGTAPTSGFFFRKDDDDTQLDCVSVATGTTDTTTSLNVKTMDTNYHKYGIRITGGSKAEFYVDDALLATHSNTANFPASSVFMGPHLAHQNGDANARTCSLKHWYVAAQL